MKALSPDSFLGRLLAKLAAAVCRHPGWFFWPQVLLLFTSIAYTVGFLHFDMDQNNLVSGSKRYHHNFLEFQKEFPQQDDLAVVVESENIEKNRQFVERLGARLEAETNLFRNVFYKGDLSMMGPKALLFVPEKDLAGIRDALQEDLPFIQKFSQARNSTPIRTSSCPSGNRQATRASAACPVSARTTGIISHSRGFAGFCRRTPPSPHVAPVPGPTPLVRSGGR